MKKLKRTLFIIIIFFITVNVNAYNKAVVDITKMNIEEIQDSIDKGYLTYELLVNLYLDRIKEYDKDYNSIISINENIIEEAKECDKNHSKNNNHSMMYCIPVLVKDNIDVKGFPTTVGTKSLKDNYPNEDSDVIKNLKDAGALIIAKTNMSEFAFEASRSLSSYGTVKNAYNNLYSSYGSSGGSAVAVALRFGTVAIGTDTNASIRVPSAANNVIGFRPTFDTISAKGVFAYDITRDTVGPITTNVIDNMYLLDSLKNSNTYSDNNFNEQELLKNKKIGVLTEFVNKDNTYEPLFTLFNNAINNLKSLGAEIIYIDDFLKNNKSSAINNTYAGWTMCYAYNNYIVNTNSKLKTFYSLAEDKGHIFSLWSYYDDCNRSIDNISNLTKEKETYNEYVESIFKKYDIDALVYLPIVNKILKQNESSKNFKTFSNYIAPVLGYPSVVVSIGSIDDLYYGMEFVGLKNTENILYEIIYEYQKNYNYYEVPESTPNLYEIPKEVEELKKINENKSFIKFLSKFISTKTLKEYNNTLKEINKFLTNYNDYEDTNTKSKELLTNYNKSLNSLNKLNNQIKAIIIIIFIFYLIIKLLKLYFKIKKKDKKKKRKISC